MENISGIEDIIRLYGSIEGYNEEQRRCGLAQIELAAPLKEKNVQMDVAAPVALAESTTPEKPAKRSRRFSLALQLFGAGAWQ
jgi:hypothetical protein